MILERITKNNLSGTIEQELEPQNPRTEIEQLARLILWHNKYKIGDEHNFTPEEFKEMMKKEEGLYVPVYMYEHTGITISTAPFSCPWDSGQVGWAYLTKRLIDLWHKGDEAIARESIEAEVREYDNYLRGDIYLIKITNEKDEIVQCCGGFIGFDYARDSLIEMLAFLGVWGGRAIEK